MTTKGIEFLMTKNKIDVFNGFGSFKDATHVVITSETGEETIEGKNIIIATGSKTNFFNNEELKIIVTSWEFYETKNMAGNKEFKEKLIKRAFNLARDTIRLVDKFPKKRASWVIADQLLRAITSIGANIIEAQAASSKRDFINFLHY